MIYSANAEIVSFLKNLMQSLQPYAKASEINLTFSSDEKSRVVSYQPFLLSQSIVQLICNLINLLPPKSKIVVRLICEENQDLRFEVKNNGLNLIHIPEIISNSVYSFTGNPLQHGTLYTLIISSENQPASSDNQLNQKLHTNDPPQFYREIQKRFTQHFTRTERLIASLEKNRPQEAAFIQKINTLIKVNLENEDFGTDDLCKAMFLSRTQLFRKMKSLINEAPANYIRNIRLQKAKELLETSDLTVSEVAYKSGFQTINHFTKIFKEEYGIPPSVYRHNNHNATNG
jgi:AraC-like DNA-binding protein